MTEKQLHIFSAIFIVAGSVVCALGIAKENTIAAYAGGALCTLMIVIQPFRSVVRSFYRWWMKFSTVLAWINTRILLAALFFFIVTPIGWIMRLLGKRPLDLSVYDGNQTAWVDCEEHRENHWERMY